MNITEQFTTHLHQIIRNRRMTRKEFSDTAKAAAEHVLTENGYGGLYTIDCSLQKYGAEISFRLNSQKEVGFDYIDQIVLPRTKDWPLWDSLTDLESLFEVSVCGYPAVHQYIDNTLRGGGFTTKEEFIAAAKIAIENAWCSVGQKMETVELITDYPDGVAFCIVYGDRRVVGFEFSLEDSAWWVTGEPVKPSDIPKLVEVLQGIDQPAVILEASSVASTITTQNLFDCVKGFVRSAVKQLAPDCQYGIQFLIKTRALPPSIAALVNETFPTENTTFEYLEELRKGNAMEEDEANKYLAITSNPASYATAIRITLRPQGEPVILHTLNISTLKHASKCLVPSTRYSNGRHFWQMATRVQSDAPVVKKVPQHMAFNERFSLSGVFDQECLSLFAEITATFEQMAKAHGNVDKKIYINSRIADHLLRDLNEWLDRYAYEFQPEDAQGEYEYRVIRSATVLELVVMETRTRQQRIMQFTLATLNKYLESGLDWHPEAQTFWIPNQL